ncbi:MAG TPA: hypothetical protein VM779_11710 [Thermoanaerobaculia bacterium]|nr:hypothetical protein [Thermoanaerobaculia bacterium]
MKQRSWTTRPDTKATAVAVTLLLLGGTTSSAQTGWGIGKVNDDLYFSDLDRGRILKLSSGGSLDVLLEDVHCHNLAPGYDSHVYGEAVGRCRHFWQTSWGLHG